MQSTVRKTFQEGSVWAAILEFEDSAQLGFTMWRWLPRAALKSGRTQTFQVTHLSAISSLLDRLPEEMETLAPADASKGVQFEPRLARTEEPLYAFTVDDVLLTVHSARRGPWFMLRRIVSTDPLYTANWFFANQLTAVDEARTRARLWFEAQAPAA